MIFNSLTYFLFLIAVLIGFQFVSRNLRISFFILCSIIFYGFWSFPYYMLLVVSATIDFSAGKLISRSEDSIKQKLCLTFSIVTNLSILGYYKYSNFFIEQLNSVAETEFALLNVILPIGISFYTFQSMSYTIDIYRGKIRAESNFLHFLNYISFFPQLVAGPIIRYDHFRSQIKKMPDKIYTGYNSGFRLIVYGLFLKVCIADNLAPFIDDGFLISPSYFGTLDVLTLSYAFGFQIYFDFGGYSLIAIGTARLFGIHFPNNFEFPYLATSVREFWNRWHISLSSWIRDYLYEPLKGLLPHSLLGSFFALLITWSVMGFWHGSSWNFVMWGLWNGVAIFIARIVHNLVKDCSAFRPSIYLSVFGWILSLNTIMLGWIWFRAQNIQDALQFYNALLLNRGLYFTLNPNLYFMCSVILLFVIFSRKIWSVLFSESLKSRIISTFIIDPLAIISVLIFLSGENQFIYFQF